MTDFMPDQIDRRFILAPHDPDARDRVKRLHALGFRTDAPDDELDQFAEKLAHVLGTPFGMVNFVLDTHQYFAGLYNASTANQGSTAKVVSVGRTMDLDDGFCVHVVDVNHALVLDSASEWPRFGTNTVIRTLGVQSYIGAPFYDGNGKILGTVCGISNERGSWGSEGVELIKAMASEVSDLVATRERDLEASTSQGQGTWFKSST